MITQNEADLFCKFELKTWKLSNIDIVWKDMKNFLGLADVANNRIILSTRILTSSPLFIEVVRHEICHVLDYQERGTFLNDKGRNDFHGKSFKKWCAIVNVKCRRLIPV
jgi:predicted SprT family Zn-dependent metalloprotease